MCYSTQLNFEFENLLCVFPSVRLCVRVCVRAQRLLSYPRRDDWICQPAGTLITSAIFRLTSRNHSHLWEGNELGHSGSRRSRPSRRFKSVSGEKEIKQAEQYRWRPEHVRYMEKFLVLLLRITLSKTAGTKMDNKRFDVNRHFWV